MNSLRNASRVFLQILHRHPLGMQDELTRLVDPARHALGHEWGIHMLIKVSQHVGEYINNNQIMGHYLGWLPSNPLSVSVDFLCCMIKGVKASRCPEQKYVCWTWPEKKFPFFFFFFFLISPIWRHRYFIKQWPIKRLEVMAEWHWSVEPCQLVFSAHTQACTGPHTNTSTFLLPLKLECTLKKASSLVIQRWAALMEAAVQLIRGNEAERTPVKSSRCARRSFAAHCFGFDIQLESLGPL